MSRNLLLVLGLGLAVSATVADAEGASRHASATHSDQSPSARRNLPAPRTVTATLHPKARTVTIAWSRVKGASAYHVAAFAAAVAGPQVPHTVKAPTRTFTIAYSKLPRSTTGGFRFAVSATGQGAVSESAYTNLKIRSLQDKRVRKTITVEAAKPSTLDKAAAAARGCLKAGFSVGVGSAAAGAPFVVFGVAIPGVGEVTAAGLGAVATFGGGSATLACLAGKVL